ncbi:hemin-degrading family protein precursor [Pseudonocardia sp. Ae406_Ps2]|uniref:hypothetical protein n=1 Tax=unclassified Pseudonocardia TaxID=2619320 RepID=UPI00094B20E6|nr:MULTISPECIES: hypothetical protein [unclassified Pseudonocardia]OLL96993.1 hemin-degrading family protein precursor [Pseudonocardia sp. Ae331_Ps2]OLM05297.1 hemin-degrading family protein precursor [Pseudonocardia sp. Ae406_Ps2]OLM09886.1 hemin-degrading family protein precursor [Pseudonocardia sp. Ae505_Ps2]OLM26867.1 hemin-degrading family protein precursor [Pseudonocardia sp. Ae706_Ps2]OLM33070.1 hemin-degrading family protein precursor [Pseudonocardia sp. Ae717_Ps2]
MTLPHTDLDVLLSHLVGERLDLDAGTLARHLPLLDEVVATTANGIALISELGTYAEPTFTGEAFGVRADAVTLRLSRPAVAAVVATRADDERREPAALWLFDGDGGAVHRTHLLSPDAPLVTEVMRLAPRVDDPPVVPTAVPDELDHLGLLDALTDGGGRVPAGLVPAAPPCDVARAVDLLCLLCEHGVPAGLAVPNGGCLQVGTGSVDHVETADVVGVVSGAVQFAFAPGEIEAVRPVRTHGPYGPMTTVLLTGPDGRCPALIGQFGLPSTDVVTAWERMVRDVLLHPIR